MQSQLAPSLPAAAAVMFSYIPLSRANREEPSSPLACPQSQLLHSSSYSSTGTVPPNFLVGGRFAALAPTLTDSPNPSTVSRRHALIPDHRRDTPRKHPICACADLPRVANQARVQRHHRRLRQGRDTLVVGLRFPTSTVWRRPRCLRLRSSPCRTSACCSKSGAAKGALNHLVR